MNQGFGKTLIIIGSIIVTAGLIISFRDSLPFLKNLGKFPGDINIRRENFSFHFPLMTSLIVSIILSLLLYMISRFRG